MIPEIVWDLELKTFPKYRKGMVFLLCFFVLGIRLVSYPLNIVVSYHRSPFERYYTKSPPNRGERY